MSELVTVKIGGTSNATAERMQQSLGWARNAVITTVSAPGRLPGEGIESEKVTDLLNLSYDEYAKEGEISKPLIDLVVGRYSDVVQNSGSQQLKGRWLDGIPDKMHFAVRAGKDAAAMLGEQLMAEVYHLGEGFIKLDVGEAPGNLGTDPEAWRSWLGQVVDTKSYIPYVIGGNMTTVNDELVTICRNGSDITSGLTAYAINADLNINITDSAAKTTDPKALTGGQTRVKKLDHILYKEGHVLGWNGSGLIHPDAMVPLMIGGIPTEIGSPGSTEHDVTLMDNDVQRAAKRVGEIVAMALNTVAFITVDDPNMASHTGSLAMYEHGIAASGISLIDSIGYGPDAQQYLVSEENIDATVQAIEDNLGLGARIASVNLLSTVTVAGFRLHKSYLEKTRSLVKAAGFNVKQWQKQHKATVSEHGIRLPFDLEDGPKALDNLHKMLFEAETTHA